MENLKVETNKNNNNNNNNNNNKKSLKVETEKKIPITTPILPQPNLAKRNQT